MCHAVLQVVKSKSFVIICLGMFNHNFFQILSIFCTELKHFELNSTTAFGGFGIWAKVFKNGPSENCGRQPLKKFEVIYSV